MGDRQPLLAHREVIEEEDVDVDLARAPAVGRPPPDRCLDRLRRDEKLSGLPAQSTSNTWFRKSGWSRTPKGSVSCTVLSLRIRAPRASSSARARAR